MPGGAGNSEVGAYQKNVPVLVPGFYRSEMGLSFFFFWTWRFNNRIRARGRQTRSTSYDPFLDLNYFAEKDCCNREEAGGIS